MARLLTVWLLSLAVMAAVASTMTAQRNPGFPRVVTGEDVAFKFEGLDRNGKALGSWLIRIDGEWREVGSGGGIFPVPHHVEPR
jgi:hypothetical protein